MLGIVGPSPLQAVLHTWLFWGKSLVLQQAAPPRKAWSGRFVPFLRSFHRAENAAERQGRLPRCPRTSPNCNPIPLFIKRRERAERGRHWADSLIVMLLSDNSANLIHLFHLNLAAMSPAPPSCFNPPSESHTLLHTHSWFPFTLCLHVSLFFPLLPLP